MNIRSKLIIGFTVIIVFSGAMGFNAVDGIQRTSRLTNELFEYPLMASNFARGAQTAFVRIRMAGDNAPVIAEQEHKLREDLSIVAERFPDPAVAALITHIEFYLARLARLRAENSRLAASGAGLGENLLRQEVAFSLIDQDLEALVELALVRGFDFMRAAEDQSDDVFNTQIFFVCLVLGLGLGIALYLGRALARPIRALTAATTRLAAGDDNIEIPGGGRKDEIGAMARALEVFKENVKTIRRNESELIRVRNSLELRVQERTSELAEALMAAKAANTAKSEFLATMSHELRTPLNSIIGFSEIIQEQSFGPLGAPQYGEFAKDINNSGKHLAGLIDDILEFSKIESGKMALKEEDVDVSAMIHSCASQIRQIIKRKSLNLEVNLSKNLPPMRADPTKLKQILANLLSNATKFTEAGGTVGLDAQFEPAHGHVIQVHDTGIGMAPEAIPSATNPFSQVDGSKNRKFEGAGLGLPLAKQFTELHGGSLKIQSTPGNGTSVTLRFPLERAVQPKRLVINLPSEKAPAWRSPSVDATQDSRERRRAFSRI